METLLSIYISLTFIISTFLAWVWKPSNYLNTGVKCGHVLLACVSAFYLLKGYPLPVAFCLFVGIYALGFFMLWTNETMLNKTLKATFAVLLVASLGILYLKL